MKGIFKRHGPLLCFIYEYFMQNQRPKMLERRKKRIETDLVSHHRNDKHGIQNIKSQETLRLLRLYCNYIYIKVWDISIS